MFNPFLGAIMFSITLDKRTSSQYDKPTTTSTVRITYVQGNELRILGKRKPEYCYFKTKIFGTDCWAIGDSTASPTFLFENEYAYQKMLRNEKALNVIESKITNRLSKHEISAAQIAAVMEALNINIQD